MSEQSSDFLGVGQLLSTENKAAKGQVQDASLFAFVATLEIVRHLAVVDSQTNWNMENATITCSHVRTDCSALRSIVKVKCISLHVPLISSHTHRRSITGSRKRMKVHLAMLRGADRH